MSALPLRAPGWEQSADWGPWHWFEEDRLVSICGHGYRRPDIECATSDDPGTCPRCVSILARQLAGQGPATGAASRGEQ